MTGICGPAEIKKSWLTSLTSMTYPPKFLLHRYVVLINFFCAIKHLQVAFESSSIGLPHHTLHQKIEAIRAAGFQGIELSFPDLLSYAKLHFGRKDIKEEDYETLSEAAKAVQLLCSKERKDAFDRPQGWIKIMEAAGINMLQLAYDNWCWSTHAPTSKDVWKIVRWADRPNIGLCLDTFQTAGGRIEIIGLSRDNEERGVIVTPENLTRRYRASLDQLAQTVPSDKIYFFQISDAYNVNSRPLSEREEGGVRPRGRWSHESRPLPYDGGCLPISEVVTAVLATGFKGWVSVEVFDGKFDEKYGEDLGKFAQKAAYKRLFKEAEENLSK
ncbi:xylose isomerase-like protein [Podospora fimiseda]|uniref:Xylose isomerase-like protein n=1 Tax=Podospora fimiseda TaxID=252190 RepID=A0AAN7BIE5_9PEZI|nr:xylose isomerase-like protein [Podospora fimiseda]